MRALICDHSGGIEGLRTGELVEPEPGPGAVLIKVEAAAATFADTLMACDDHQTEPFAPGREVAGTVVVVNQARGISPGDRVCGLLPHGGMAEKAVVAAESVTRLPDAVPFQVGAVLPATYGAAYHALTDRGTLQEGETLLVLGAAGGMGTAAVQIGAALGALVVAAVSSNEKARFIADAGADEIIRCDAAPLRDGVDELTDGKGVDVVFDPVGAEMTEQALRSTRRGGRLLVIGFAGGSIPRIPLDLLLSRGVAVVGACWEGFASEQAERRSENTRTIVEWVESGRLKPPIRRTFSLGAAKEALHLVADRKTTGRVIVVP